MSTMWGQVELVDGMNSSLERGANSSNHTTNSTNGTNMILSPYYQHSPAVAASFILAYLFIFLLCMGGNGLVCMIVLRNRRMRTVTNLFILNLAISDLLVGVFCIPTTLVDNLITGWPFTNAVCKMSGLVQGMSVSASVFTLVAIALDRYRCIVYPFKPKLTPLVAKVTIALIWVLAFLIMCPSATMLMVAQEEGHYMVDNQDHNRTYPLYYCYETWPEPGMRKVYTTVLFAHIYLIPLMLITLMYCRIGSKLYTSAVLSAAEHPELVPAGGHAGRPPVSPKKIRVIKMLILVALLFMLSWLPLWTVILLTDYAQPEGEQLEIVTGYVFPFAHWLAFSNSSVNPIIYGYFNENFKRGFQAACQHELFSCLHTTPAPGKTVRDGQMACPRDGIGNMRSLNLGPHNRVYTGNDQTESVRLEMEPRNNQDGKPPGTGGGKTTRDVGQGGGANKKLLQVDTKEKLTPVGAAVCQAWDWDTY